VWGYVLDNLELHGRMYLCLSRMYLEALYSVPSTCSSFQISFLKVKTHLHKNCVSLGHSLL